MTLVEAGVGLTVASVIPTMVRERRIFMSLFATFNSIAFVIIMMIGLYTLIARQNLVKTLGLGLFQTGIFLCTSPSG